MRFLIADTFTSSLSKLTSEEQTFVKNTAFDLQVNPAHPGLQFHRIERAKDKNFWSVRSGRDLRIIVHKTEADFLLCYVNHHDAAYAWAERRKLQVHPRTGAAQLIEIRQTVQEQFAAKPFKPATVLESKKIFADLDAQELLKYGVPPDFVDSVRESTEDSILALFDVLPAEAAEALLELATGGKPEAIAETLNASDPFAHPDAKRRFSLISSSAELTRALEFPWDKWAVFLHPEQRAFAEKNFNGPARVAGAAGTGKTVVAIHRAYNLARANQQSRLLLATFSDSLANALQGQLSKLISSQPQLAEQIEVLAMPTLIKQLYRCHFGNVSFASESQVKQGIALEKAKLGIKKFTTHFLWKEWEQIIDAWQIISWEQYRRVPRLGRKTRLTEEDRSILWKLFENVLKSMQTDGLLTEARACHELISVFQKIGKYPYDYAVIDEAQDISVPQLRLLASMLGQKPNGLFFSGDLGQRIFQLPFSWSALGVDIRGRSKTLKVNYRTSQEIRKQSDRLLDGKFTDVDGVSEDRTGTISVFSGPPPIVFHSDNSNDENQKIAGWLRELIGAGFKENEICVIVRSENEINRAMHAISLAGFKANLLESPKSNEQIGVNVSIMHLAKGLEFRAVAVIACDDDVLPLQSRIESVGDEGDLQEVYATERQLLYVACTRARDCLVVSGVEPVSEFFGDFEEA